MIFGLFRRRVIDKRAMNEDWAVGDLAECIDGDRWIKDFASEADPKTGDILRVRELIDAVNHHSVRAYFLFFEGKSEVGYASQAFRKIRPLHEPASKEFIESIRKRSPEQVNEADRARRVRAAIQGLDCSDLPLP